MLGKPQRERIGCQDPSLLSSELPDNSNLFNFPNNSNSNFKVLQRTNFKNSQNLNNSQNKNINEFPSYHERFLNYIKVRNRIFNEELSPPISVLSPRFQRLQNFRTKSKIKKDALRAVDEIKPIRFSDYRPFSTVMLEGRPIQGLLDSGANISVLGKDSLQFLEDIGKSIVQIRSTVATSDGSKQNIVGVVDLVVNFKDQEKSHRFYVVPTLKQSLYLGFDFWRSFNIAPELHKLEISEVSLSPDVPKENPEMNQHDLTSVQLSRLNKVKTLFPSSSDLGLGHTSLLIHRIDTGDAEPIKSRHYPVSPKVQELMYAELDRMLALGVIEEAESPWNSPVVLVRKPGKNRLCLDSRRLNDVTKKLAYALPNINGLLSRLSDTHFISCIDLKDAFWQIELDEVSREKTAFTVPGRPQYQYCVMPFGLCNAAQRLCQLMDKVFPSTVRSKIFVYLDDLLVVSKTFDEHLVLLSDVANRLRNAGLTVNIAKSRFCYKEVKYLGHIVGHGTIRPDPEKVSAILDFPVPVSVKQVRRFVGMCGYYGKFVENYSSLSSPLTDTIKKGKFIFTPEALESFEKLKKSLVSEPVLVHPNFEKPFFIHCDASRFGVGACLMQKDTDDEDRAICFFSKKLNSSQKNYTVTELECLAVVLAVEKFRPYIELQEFTIVTDHSALKWLMNQKDLNGRLARWSLRLQRFEFKIQHRKGQHNVVPDALSREGDIAEISHTMPLVDLTDEAFTSEEYVKLRETITQNSESLPDLKVSENFVYKRILPRTGSDNDELVVWRLWIPTPLTQNLIHQAHTCDDGLHYGSAKVIHKLKQLYFWPKLGSQVHEFIRNCEKCKAVKNTNTVLRPEMGKPFIVERPFQHLYMDFIGPYPRTKAGFTQVLVVLDQLTKFPILAPLRSATSLTTIEALEKLVFSTFNVPETILTDKGSQFMSNTFQNFLDVYGVTHLPTPPHHPQANASERLNQSIIQGIRVQIENDHTKWDQGLNNIAFALRSTIHETIGMSPHFALFGDEMVCHGSTYKLLKQLDCLKEPDILVIPKADKMRKIHDEIMEKIQDAHERNERRYNLRSRGRKFEVGQTVFRRLFHQSNLSKHYNAKFDQKFKKCRIKSILSENRFEIEDTDGKYAGTYHAKDLKS